MSKDYKAIRKIVVFVAVVSLFMTSGLPNRFNWFTSQTTYAGQTAKSKDADKAGYKTIEVTHSDYTEKSTIKNVELSALRNDFLFIDKQQGTFVEYLVKSGQAVKKGDRLVSYQIPGDSISVEENKLKLKHNEEAYRLQSQKMKASIVDSEKQLKSMDHNSVEAKILEINVKKLNIQYEQYNYQTVKSLDDMRKMIRDLKAANELQYIEAPYDGIVNYDGKIKVKEGTALNQGTPIIHIFDTKSAVFRTPVTATSKLWYDMKVSVQGNEGRVIAADSLLNGKASSGMFYINLVDTNSTTKLQKADVTANTVLVKNVIVIPVKAVKMANGISYVNILDDTGEVRKQYITGRDNGTDMWVYNGLSDGQKIIAE